MRLRYFDADETYAVLQKERNLNTWQTGAGVLALTLVLAAIGTSWVLTRQQSESVSVAPQEDKTMIAKPTTRADTKAAPSLPTEDVSGEDMPDLPRYPGSVRVEYERNEQDLLIFTRVGYLSHTRVDVIRAFYRGVFRAEGWKVANVEFSEGEWTFLVVHAEREATVEIEPHGRGVTRMDIVLSEPLAKKESAQKMKPQKREAKPAPKAPTPSEAATLTPTPASQSASPAPQTASPAPAPGYDDDGAYGDDFGDDEGGDD
jgi:hypothetical protein